MIKNKNGKENTWATKGFNVLALDKIKEHRLKEKHKEAEQLELQQSSMNQPSRFQQEQLFYHVNKNQ
jgi:hypothetical protein